MSLFVIRPDISSYVTDLQVEKVAFHEAIEIKYFYSGMATLMIGDKIINVEAGDTVVVNPYEFHTTINVDNGKYHLFIIPLDFFSDSGVDVLNLRALLLENGNVFKNLYHSDKRLGKILTRIVKEYSEKKDVYETAITGLAMELFAMLIRKGLCKSNMIGYKKGNLRLYKLIEPSIRHIRDYYSDDITVDALAEICNLSKSYFCRSFKNITGKTVMEYLMDYRLKIADSMLRNSDMIISDIAEKCGFQSMSYFCRSYKKLYGIKPSERR